LRKLTHISRLQDLQPDELAALEACAKDKFVAKETLLKVFDKAGRLVPLRSFPHHRKYHQYAKPISHVVKGRQVYMTTDICGDFYLDCCERKGINSIFINLDSKKTEEVFRRVHTFHENYPKCIRPKLKTKQSGLLIFEDRKTSFHAITSKNDGGKQAANDLGRSITAQNVHISEAASIIYLKDLLDGMFGSRPKGADSKSRVILEGTGNGAQGEFYFRCMEIHDNGTLVAPNTWHYGDQSLHFIPWFEHLEYRMAGDPFLTMHIPEESRRLWQESEVEHREAMDANDDMDEGDKVRALKWRRYVAVNEYKLTKDPMGCIRTMNQEYPATLLHAFQASGKAYLSLTLTEQNQQKWKKFNEEGDFAPLPIPGRLFHKYGDTPTFKPEYGGEIQVFFPPITGWRDRYLVFADIGGGHVDSDRDYIGVRDRLNNMTVCVAHGTFGPKKTARLMLALGVWYDMAKLVWENNNHGIGVTIELRNADYPNLWCWNDKRDVDIDFGWRTSETTRKTMLELFKNSYEDQITPLQILFLPFYKEARAFQIPPGKRRPEGIDEFDDCVIAEAIGNAVSKTMPEPERIVRIQKYHPGQVGYLKQKAFGKKETPLGLRNM